MPLKANSAPVVHVNAAGQTTLGSVRAGWDVKPGCGTSSCSRGSHPPLSPLPAEAAKPPKPPAPPKPPNPPVLLLKPPNPPLVLPANPPNPPKPPLVLAAAGLPSVLPSACCSAAVPAAALLSSGLEPSCCSCAAGCSPVAAAGAAEAGCCASSAACRATHGSRAHVWGQGDVRAVVRTADTHTTSPAAAATQAPNSLDGGKVHETSAHV